jgi:hypothetical protein
MRLQTKPYRWSCILAAFAMALDVSIEDLITLLRHDGSEVFFPDLPEPACRRGFHVQEFIHVALCLNRSVTPYELVPAIAPTGYNRALHGRAIGSAHRKAFFEHLIDNRRGVITGRTLTTHHAVAFEKGVIYDPDGWQFPFSFESCEKRGFFAQCVWIVAPIGS